VRLRLTDGFNHKFAVSRVVEEAPRLPCAAHLL
jgi:hypothetical protein